MDLTKVSDETLQVLEDYITKIAVFYAELNKSFQSRRVFFRARKLNKEFNKFNTKIDSEKSPFLKKMVEKFISMDFLQEFDGKNCMQKIDICSEYLNSLAYNLSTYREDKFYQITDNEYFSEEGSNLIVWELFEEPAEDIVQSIADIENISEKSNEEENLDVYIEKYGPNIVESAEKRIKEYGYYLVPGNIFLEEELPYICDKFSENNEKYKDILYKLNTNGYYTMTGCIGHNEFDHPYVGFSFELGQKENLKRFLDYFSKDEDYYGFKTLLNCRLRKNQSTMLFIYKFYIYSRFVLFNNK